MTFCRFISGLKDTVFYRRVRLSAWLGWQTHRLELVLMLHPLAEMSCQKSGQSQGFTEARASQVLRNADTGFLPARPALNYWNRSRL